MKVEDVKKRDLHLLSWLMNSEIFYFITNVAWRREIFEAYMNDVSKKIYWKCDIINQSNLDDDQKT
jgi:hypothetical protein